MALGVVFITWILSCGFNVRVCCSFLTKVMALETEEIFGGAQDFLVAQYRDRVE